MSIHKIDSRSVSEIQSTWNCWRFGKKIECWFFSFFPSIPAAPHSSTLYTWLQTPPFRINQQQYISIYFVLCWNDPIIYFVFFSKLLNFYLCHFIFISVYICIFIYIEIYIYLKCVPFLFLFKQFFFVSHLFYLYSWFLLFMMIIFDIL